MDNQPLDDQSRFPLLDPTGQHMLKRLREHPHAPRYNYHGGEKLTAEGLSRVVRFREQWIAQPNHWMPHCPPSWIESYTQWCLREVPFYRERAARTGARHGHLQPFVDQKPIDRDDLRRAPWKFVPDSAALDELVVYSTSGTTGNLVQVICDPTAPVSYLPLMQWALETCGVTLCGGNRVTLVHVAAQHRTFTQASIMSYFGGAGFAKVNLHPAEWSKSTDREAFLDDCDPEFYTGDPFALLELAKLDLRTRPKAIVSCATTLLPAARAVLEQRFACPVIDMISMNETGPIAFSMGGPFRFFPHRLYVEIMTGAGESAELGERGEIVVTGGVNELMPLLRYRTGDFAALTVVDGHPTLTEFVGRTPVDFYRTDGSLVRSIDVVVALYAIPLPLFRLAQSRDGALTLQTRCDLGTQRQVLDALQRLFGAGAVVRVEQLSDAEIWRGKAIQFTSDYGRYEEM